MHYGVFSDEPKSCGPKTRRPDEQGLQPPNPPPLRCGGVFPVLNTPALISNFTTLRRNLALGIVSRKYLFLENQILELEEIFVCFRDAYSRMNGIGSEIRY